MTSHDDDVIVVFGGDGNEHRVSVASAQNVSTHLPAARLWYWTREGLVLETPRDELVSFERPFETDFQPAALKDWDSMDDALADPAGELSALFLALHGGTGEDGTLQSKLESLGRAFTGSGARASRLAFDKPRARELLRGEGVLVAEGCLVDESSATHERLAELFERHGKVVVKPAADGSSHGVRIVDDERKLSEAVVAVRRSRTPYLAEAFVTGREVTVGVIDDGGERALPCSEVKLDPGRSFDFEGKYLGKGTVELTPAPLDDSLAAAVQNVALTAHRAVGCCGYSRTDVIVADERPVFLEINTLPGLTAASFIPQQLDAAGIPLERFLDRQLEIARNRA